MMSKFVIAAAAAAVLSISALPANAQAPAQLGAPTAGGQAPANPGGPGANSVVVPDATAQVPTTRNTVGSTPMDDSNSASARGGPGTGPVPGTNTNR